MNTFGQFVVLLAFILLPQSILAEPSKQVYFGDTHLHTSNSFDAYLMFNRDAGPDTAYRWAKGMPVIHPYTRTRVQIGTPLDFLVISDHAEYLGVMPAIDQGTVEFDQLDWWGSVKRWVAVRWLKWVLGKDTIEYEDFYAIAPTAANDESNLDQVLDASNQEYLAKARLANAESTNGKTWAEIADAADRHNEPGHFTALIGWEWSSMPGGGNLHRVVFTPDNADVAKQFLPFSTLDSQYPKDLWEWLEATNRKTGANFLAIPHNSNGSKGRMFDVATLRGQPITEDYARLRDRWEPVVEITQIKGDSETHPIFSPGDEFADFEKFYLPALSKSGVVEPKAGDYIRPALKRGLSIQNDIGVNPYRFGVIGSTDSHTGLSSAEENNFWGKVATDSLPEFKENDLLGKGINGWSMSASGLAAVWAEENTREAIFAAFQRREVYATTGPMIRVRVKADWSTDNLNQDDLGSSEEVGESEDSNGVPMGGQLVPTPDRIAQGAVPSFYVEALRDPASASLDRIQMIKGWIDSDGETHEKIYEVAWSGERELDSQGKLPPVQNTVDIKTGAYDDRVGVGALSVRWTDPDFNPADAAFYYVRVLEIPTPRHSLLDAIALNQELAEKDGPATIQERAYTSSIWYQPI